MLRVGGEKGGNSSVSPRPVCDRGARKKEVERLEMTPPCLQHPEGEREKNSGNRVLPMAKKKRRKKERRKREIVRHAVVKGEKNTKPFPPHHRRWLGRREKNRE